MPARDYFHETVKRTLIKEGWTITHDPYHLQWGGKEMYVDLGAEQLLAAERTNERIAVEVKSFLGKSFMEDLEKALGQFVLYRSVLSYRDPERRLFLAIPFDVAKIFEEPLGQMLLENNLVRVISFDPQIEEIVKWIP